MNGGLELGDGFFEVTLLPESDAKGIGSVGLRRIDGFGFAEFGDGFGQFVLKLQGEAEIVVESLIVGRALQSGLKFRDRGDEIGFLKIGGAEIPLIARIIRAQTQGLAKGGN